MLIQFTGTTGAEKKPVYFDPDQVRLVAVNDSNVTVIYQQGSDNPIFVSEDIDAVVKAVNEGRSKNGN